MSFPFKEIYIRATPETIKEICELARKRLGDDVRAINLCPQLKEDDEDEE